VAIRAEEIPDQETDAEMSLDSPLDIFGLDRAGPHRGSKSVDRWSAPDAPHASFAADRVRRIDSSAGDD
jgi:hypothetical protein